MQKRTCSYISRLGILVLFAVLESCSDTFVALKASPDGSASPRIVTLPDGQQRALVFTLGNFASESGLLTKPVTITFTYTQAVPGSKSATNLGSTCDSNTLTTTGNDCDKTVTTTTTVTAQAVEGDVWTSPPINIGDPGQCASVKANCNPCVTSENCRGSATIAYQNHNGLQTVRVW